MLVPFVMKAQETPPAFDANFKQLSTSQFYIHLPDSALWHYKGTVFGWERLASLQNLEKSVNFVTPETFGAVGDGTTDDLTAWQAAVASGKEIRPTNNKRYYLSATLNITAGTIIRGTGVGNTASVYINGNYTAFAITGDNVLIDGVSFFGTWSGGSITPTYPLQRGISVVGSLSPSTEYPRIQISNCTGYELDGAFIYIANNGFDKHQGVQVSNCNAFLCQVGYLSDVRGEYNTFSNCVASSCYIGAEIAGGNNNFIGGIFTNNAIGFHLLGGANNAHAVITGALINHNTFFGIHAESVTYGYNFVGCSIYANNIWIDNSTGIAFSAGDISADTIYFQNSNKTFFDGVKFVTDPLIYLNWNGTDNTGTASDVRWFNNKFYTPRADIYNELQEGIIAPSYSIPSGTGNEFLLANGTTTTFGTTSGTVADGSLYYPNTGGNLNGSLNLTSGSINFYTGSAEMVNRSASSLDLYGSSSTRNLQLKTDGTSVFGYSATAPTFNQTSLTPQRLVFSDGSHNLKDTAGVTVIGGVINAKNFKASDLNDGVAGALVSDGAGNVIKAPLPIYGSFSLTGNGTTSVKYTTSDYEFCNIVVQPKNAAALTAGQFYVTTDATGITLTFATATINSAYLLYDFTAHSVA